MFNPTDHVGSCWRNNVLSALRGGLADQTVADVMDVDIVTADIDDSVYDVQQRMSELSRWAVPVVEDGQYRGIFTADRFVHLYRQLNPSRLHPKYAAGFTTVANSLNWSRTSTMPFRQVSEKIRSTGAAYWLRLNAAFSTP